MLQFDLNLNKSGEELPFVNADDPAVIEGIDRITRLLQLKRVMMDNIEGVLFGSAFKATNQICLINLAQVFMNRLNMEQTRCIKFTRFLMEEKDENEGQPNQKHFIFFDPHEKKDLQLVIVKLMVNVFPFIYRDVDEEEARSNFTEVFS